MLLREVTSSDKLFRVERERVWENLNLHALNCFLSCDPVSNGSNVAGFIAKGSESSSSAARGGDPLLLRLDAEGGLRALLLLANKDRV